MVNDGYGGIVEHSILEDVDMIFCAIYAKQLDTALLVSWSYGAVANLLGHIFGPDISSPAIGSLSP